MKIAISIEPGLLDEADRTAVLMRVSRSRFFAGAVRGFIGRQRKEQMLIRLNDVYAKSPVPAEIRVLKGIKAKARATVKERW